MTFPGRAMVQGTFTAPASLPGVQLVNCGFIPSKVQLINRTALTSMVTGTPLINPGANYLGFQWDWNTDFGSTVTQVLAMAPAASVTNVPVVSNGVITSNGIAAYNGQIAAPGINSVTLGATVTAGALSKASAASMTSTAHGLSTGDQIVITGPFTATTAMNQLGGIRFTVTVTNANAFTIPINTNVANFTATTVTTYRKVLNPAYYYPQNTVITGITAANPMVVTTATNHGFTVGQAVRLNVPAVMGMTQANNIAAVITAVTATTFTLGSVDSSAFTAFGWPATTSVPFNPARVIPIGSGPTPTTFLPSVQYNYDTLDDATTNQAFQGFSVGSNILVAASTTVLGVTASDVISWTAWRQDA
jgi:hypothetical protein